MAKQTAAEKKSAEDKAEAERLDADKAEAERLDAEKLAAEQKAAVDKAAADKAAAAKKKATSGLRITAIVAGFRRCGVAHSVEPVEYEAGRFSPEEIEALKAEPSLVVEEF